MDLHLTCPPHSSIRLHVKKLDYPISVDNFSIVGSTNNTLELKIIESLNNLKQNLNDIISVFPLKLS